MDAFLVRVWRPGTPRADDDRGLHGTVVHLPSRQTRTFQDQEALLAILRGGDGDDTVAESNAEGAD